MLRWGLMFVTWVAWLYPLLFRAPHAQKRPSITVAGPTRVGLILESGAIFLACLLRREGLEVWQCIAALVLAGIATWLSWTSVTHLGKQFRVHAGLYEDHQLVRTGPYAIVRHPIYASLLCMLLCTILLLTRWKWGAISVAIFIAGTEIRVHSEDRLLASRFGTAFEEYRKRVPAYVPFVR